MIKNRDGIKLKEFEEEKDFFQIVSVTEQELDVPQKYSDEVNKMVTSYKPEIPKEVPVTMKIVLTDETSIYVKPRRLPFSQQNEVKIQVDEWLKDGIIKPLTSSYCSPVVITKKKDGSSRLCIDYSRINQRILKDQFPVPHIEEIIDQLEGFCVFSTLDLKNGFFHVPIDETSTKYTAFVTKEGQFEFMKAPFGLTISPAAFLRLVHCVFSNLIKKKIVLTYMDDIVIPSKDEIEGLEKLKIVLKVTAKNGLSIQWSKCHFLQRRVLFSGHIIMNNNIHPSEEKI